jgi:tetratricopeptide (TPR) repeat protein
MAYREMKAKTFQIIFVVTMGMTIFASPKIASPFTQLAQPEARQVSQSAREARESLNRGIEAYTEQKYDEAARHMEKAIESDPTFEVARMYLGTIYARQFIPGATDQKNVEMANKAIDAFKQAVDNATNPNLNAMLSIALLYSQLNKYPESRTWYNKILRLDPQISEAYFRIGVIDFNDSLDKTGLQGEKVISMTLADKKAVLAIVDEGLTYMKKALELRPDYLDAMEYQKLLAKEKSKLEK